MQVFPASLAVPLLLASVLAAAPPKLAPPAPVPAQILAARKVFVANGGGDRGLYPGQLLSGEPERAYNGFYAALKDWGHYDLAGAPSDADVLFEIRFTARPGFVAGGDSASWDAQFRLVIRDAKSNAKLWTLIEQVDSAGLQGNRDKNFDQALARLVADVQRLAAP